MRRNATHQLLKAGTKNCSASGSEELEPRRGEPMKRVSLMTGSLFCRFHRAPILVQIRTKPKSHFCCRYSFQAAADDSKTIFFDRALFKLDSL